MDGIARTRIEAERGKAGLGPEEGGGGGEG